MGRAQKESVYEVIGKGTVFPGAPKCSNPQDGLSTHFPNPRVVGTLKRPTLEEKYLLLAGYRFIIPKAGATVNKPPLKCIAIYQAAFSYGLRFLLHPVIVEILSKYELVPTQIVPMSWHNVCSFIATCELHRLSCIGCVFGLHRLCLWIGAHNPEGSEQDRGHRVV